MRKNIFYLCLCFLFITHVNNAYAFKWFDFWSKKIKPQELISEGYHFLLYASQTNNSIELYDFESERPRILLSSKENNIEYLAPVIGNSGKCFFVKKVNRFEEGKNYSDIIQYDTKNNLHEEIGLRIINIYSKLALSPEENKIAFVLKETYESDETKLGVYDLEKKLLVEKIDIGNRFYDNPIILTWLPDNETVQIGDTITGKSALEINTKTGVQKNIKEFPLYYTEKHKLIKGDDDIYLEDLETQIKIPLNISHKTAHSFSLSKDGKYLVYGWLRGKGFETLVIKDLTSNRKFQLKMDDHPGTVLGLAMW